MSRLFPGSTQTAQNMLEDILSNGDEYDITLRRRKRITNILNRAANRHSLDLEHDTAYPYFKIGRDDTSVKKETRKAHEKAWSYAVDNISEKGFTVKDLALIGRYVLPGQDLSVQTGFRKDSVKITGASHTPPAPSTIRSQVDDMVRTVQELENPLEKAIYSHFHIARIHPFQDGNGRAARIVQNATMSNAGLIPIPLVHEQRDVYIETLDSAVRDYYSDDERYLYAFSELLVHNLMESAKEMEKCLKK